MAVTKKNPQATTYAILQKISSKTKLSYFFVAKDNFVHFATRLSATHEDNK